MPRDGMQREGSACERVKEARVHIVEHTGPRAPVELCGELAVANACGQGSLLHKRAACMT